MKKYFYRLIINDEVKKGKSFKYDYSNTKNIIIKIKKYSFEIDLEMTSEYNKENIFKKNNHLIYDAIEKAMLIHLILYSESINIKKINLKINDTINQEVLNADKQEIPIYSLVNGRLVRKMNNNWDDIEFNKLLSYTKTISASIVASLYALIMSKSKDNETERFLYLWMAFNGMYGFLYKQIDKRKGKCVHEKNEILYMIRFLNLEEPVVKELKGEKKGLDDNKKLIDEINDILANYNIDGKVTKESLINYQNGELLQNIYNKIQNKNRNRNREYATYVFLITFFAYKLRCNYFHANDKVILFSIYNENNLKALRIINDLLEEYIDNDLHKFFSDTYIIGKLKLNKIIQDKTESTSKKSKQYVNN